MRRSRSFLVASIALLFAAAPVSAGGGWTDPQRINGLQVESGSGDGPAVAVHDGKLYIAVAGGAPGKRGIYFLTNASGEWIRQRITDKRDFQPSIAVSDGAVHIAFHRQPGGPCVDDCSKGIYYALLVSGLVLVERVHRGQDFHPSIDLDRGSPRIAFNSRGPGFRGLFFSSPREDGGWQNAPLTGCCQDPTEGPSLQMKGGAAFMAVRRTSVGQNQISLVLFFEDTVDQFVFSTFPDARHPDLAIDREFTAHIAFMRDNGLWYATNDEMGDTSQFRIAAAGEGRPAITVVEADRVGVVSAGENGLVFRTNLSGTFEGTRLTDQPGDDAPDIVANAAGKSRVVFLRDVDFDSPDRVWVTREQ